jgi:hypothetical protein
MIALWHKADKFDPATSGAVAWIYTIACNLRIDAVRRGRSAERLLQDVEAEYRSEPVENTETAFSRSQEAGRLRLPCNACRRSNPKSSGCRFWRRDRIPRGRSRSKPCRVFPKTGPACCRCIGQIRMKRRA